MHPKLVNYTIAELKNITKVETNYAVVANKYTEIKNTLQLTYVQGRLIDIHR